MLKSINTPWQIGSLTLPNRLIQGPLAGFSCAPFRELFSDFKVPAYCVSEMISAHDVIHKHTARSRYLYRAPQEKILCYQIAGRDPGVLAEAAARLALLGADLIDINCGCPKPKIRKKGAGSALLEDPERLVAIARAVRDAIGIPLTIKLRMLGDERDLVLAEKLQAVGVDALIVHGRGRMDAYAVPVNYAQIARIKQTVSIPVIANGDIRDTPSLQHALAVTGCDGYMLSRAGTGAPWLYRQLLAGTEEELTVNSELHARYFMTHLERLSQLETEYKAVLQSKALVRYYLRTCMQPNQLTAFYALQSLKDIELWVSRNKKRCSGNNQL